MADSKITALTALTAADPVNDMFPVVDVSDTSMAASGTTKKISVNNILGASGTATLASATITGDLTVDTSTLKVDSTNDRVGIGTASPGKRCEINQSANAITTIGAGEILRLIGDDGNVVSRITEVGFGSGPTGATYAPVVIGAVNTSISGFGTKDFYVATRAGISDVAPLERLRVTAAGNVNITTGNVVMATSGKGIDFSAVTGGTGTATGNVLNDYEEGTWTGTITGSTTNPTIPVTATGRYTKVGRQVSVQIAFEGVSTVGASGNVGMSGLPFANTALRSIGTAGTFTGATFTGTLISVIGASSNLIEFYGVVSNSSWGAATHNASASTYFWVNITYTV